MEKFSNMQNYPRSQLIQTKQTNLWDVRIFQRDLLFITGIPKVLANEELLMQEDFLGQYGQIKHLFLKKVNVKKQNQNQFSFYQAHVRYSNEYEASLALLCLDQLKINDRHIKVFYGMSRYCPKILKGKNCFQDDCPYQHGTAKQEDCFMKNDNIKKLYFQHYDKKKILKNLIKNGLQEQAEKFIQKQSMNIFPCISSMLMQYQIAKVQQDKNIDKKQIKYGDDLFKQVEIQNLREKTKFKVIKIEQKIKNLNQQMQIYLCENFSSNIALGNAYGSSYQSYLTNKIVNKIYTQIQALHYESNLLDYLQQKLQKKSKAKIYDLYKKSLKKHLQQRLDPDLFLVQFALQVFQKKSLKKNHNKNTKYFIQPHTLFQII